MDSLKLGREIIKTARDFNLSGLSAGTSGNLSARHARGFCITPSAVAYRELSPEDIVLCDEDGRIISGHLPPSSEWPLHAAIYAARAEVNAIAHVHSAYATALACLRKPIPPFHYMVATAGGSEIPCAEYATFGSEALAKNVVAALKGQRACLMANHGLIAIGADIAAAYKLAGEVESLAKQYCLCLQAGQPVLLDDAEMRVNIEKFKTYGKTPGPQGPEQGGKGSDRKP